MLRSTPLIPLILALCSMPLASPAQEKLPSLGLRLEEISYPYEVKNFTVVNQGQALEMTYMDVMPDKANGNTVLLLHGKNFAGNYWSGTIDRLKAEGYRVVIADQVGFGKSSKPEALQYSFQQLARNTMDLLDHLQVQQTFVVGHSMGGMLAVRFALMYPDRTRALVLENPIGLEDWKLSVSYRSADEWYADELKQTLEGMRDYQRTSYYHGTWKPEYETWVMQAYGWVQSPDYPKIAWNSARAYEMIFTQPVCYEFGQLKPPTLLIIGQEDRTALGKAWAKPEVKEKLGHYPGLGKKAAAAIPNSTLVPLEKVGHIPHIEAPDAFHSVLLKFLSEKALPPPGA